MKEITQVIKLLKSIKKEGGDVSSFNLSTPVRDACPGDPGYSFEDEHRGFRQFCHDGTFTMTIYGKHKCYEPNTKSKK